MWRSKAMISWPVRYVEQQGNDKLAPLGPRAMWSSKAMKSWLDRDARYVE